MEQLNKIELAGTVGTCRVETVNEKLMARFTMAVNSAETDPSGNLYIETTWFNVVAFASEKIADLSDLEKGSQIHLVGRVRQVVLPDGYRSFEVTAQELQIVIGI